MTRTIAVTASMACLCLLLNLPGLAQDNRNPTATALAGDPNSTKIFSCWSLGANARACIAKNGNLRSFKSRDGVEHLAYGTILEGYYLNWLDSYGEYYNDRSNLGLESDSGWLAPTVSQPKGANTLPLTITRRTTPRGSSDIKDSFELKQVFSRDTAEGSLTITMTLTNKSARRIIQANFCRYADIDAAGVRDPVTGKFTSPFISTSENIISVPGSGNPAFSGMGMTAYDAWDYVTGVSSWEEHTLECGTNPSAPSPHNGVVTEIWGGQPFDGIASGGWTFGPAPPGKSVTLKVTYRGY